MAPGQTPQGTVSVCLAGPPRAKSKRQPLKAGSAWQSGPRPLCHRPESPGRTKPRCCVCSLGFQVCVFEFIINMYKLKICTPATDSAGNRMCSPWAHRPVRQTQGSLCARAWAPAAWPHPLLPLILRNSSHHHSRAPSESSKEEL